MRERMIVERNRAKESFIWAMTLIILPMLGSSCSEEQQFSGNSQLETTFQLESNSALGGSITIQQAYLKLDHIAISGALRGKNVPGASHPVPTEEPPFLLADRDSSHVRFTVTSRTYDIMDLHLALFADDYQPVFSGPSVVEVPNPPLNNGDDGADEEENEDDGEDSGVEEGNTGSDEDEDEGSGEDDGNEDDDQDENDDSGDEGEDNDDSEEDDSGNERQDEDGEDAGEPNNRDKKNDKHSDTEKKKNDKKNKKAKGGNKDNKGNGGRTGSQTVDIDHFFQNAKPGIAIFGTWDYNGQKTNIVFVVTDPERIIVRAIQNNSYRIVLEEQNTSVVSFNPEKWFQGVSVNDLQDASVQMYQGQPVLFIHKQVNSDLFHKLLSGLAQSAGFRVGTQITE